MQTNRLEITEKYNQQRQKFLDLELGVPREVTETVLSKLEQDNVTILTGLRRVGKTTVMRQLAQRLLESGVQNTNIHFFSFDDVSTRNVDFLDGLLVYLLENQPKEKVYIFLDEIQYIEDWQGTVKKYYDFYKGVKIVISGSSSVFIKNKMADSLAGRTYEFYITPLNFKEYLSIFEGVNQSFFNLGDFLANPTSQSFREIESVWAEKSAVLTRQFYNYLSFGQFPECAKLTELEDRYKYINFGIYTKLLETDLPDIYGITNIFEFKRLFEVLIMETGDYFEVDKFSGEIELAKNTVKRYLDVLAQGFLVGDVKSFNKSLRKAGRSKQKYYVGSPNFYTAFAGLRGDSMVSGLYGKVFETYVFWLMRRLYNYLFFYYKDKDEVDFLGTDNPLFKNLTVVEAKFVSRVDSQDFRVVKSLMLKKDIKNAFILSLDCRFFDLEDGRRIWALPAPVFG